MAAAKKLAQHHASKYTVITADDDDDAVSAPRAAVSIACELTKFDIAGGVFHGHSRPLDVCGAVGLRVTEGDYG